MAVKESDENSLESQFAKLKILRSNLEKEFNIKLPYLSMGMSDDYKEFPFRQNIEKDGDDGKHYKGQRYSGLYTDDTKAFPDMIEDLIRAGILDANATNDEGLTEIDDTVYKYGNGGPSALSKM